MKDNKLRSLRFFYLIWHWYLSDLPQMARLLFSATQLSLQLSGSVGNLAPSFHCKRCFES